MKVRLKDLPDEYQKQAIAKLAAMDAGSKGGKPEPAGWPSLVQEVRDAKLLEDPDRPMLVRIIRVGGRRRFDSHDNLGRGYKPLVDAIAAAFGRRSDSEEDGWAWEYEQEAGPEEGTRVEVFLK